MPKLPGSHGAAKHSNLLCFCFLQKPRRKPHQRQPDYPHVQDPSLGWDSNPLAGQALCCRRSPGPTSFTFKQKLHLPFRCIANLGLLLLFANTKLCFLTFHIDQTELFKKAISDTREYSKKRLLRNIFKDPVSQTNL